MSDQGIIIDGIKWVIGKTSGNPIPLCPKDFIQLDPYPNAIDPREKRLKCEECGEIYSLPRSYEHEKTYVKRKLYSRTFKKMRFINLDDEAIPMAREKVSSEDNKYFVTSLLIKSKIGLRLVVYAGEKGKREKTQIFVEPDIRRLAFDQKNLHPTDVFTKLEATFSDGTKSSQAKKG